jgi:hypothetical protein
MSTVQLRVQIEDTTLVIGESLFKGFTAIPILSNGGEVGGDKITIWHAQGFQQFLRIAETNCIIIVKVAGRGLTNEGIRQTLREIENAQPADDEAGNPPVRNRIVVIEVDEGRLLPAPQEHDPSGQEVL